MQGDDPIANFMVMTGCASEAAAINYLSMHDFDLTSAVVMYQADNATGPHAGASARSEVRASPLTPPPQFPPVVDVDDEDLVAHFASGSEGPTPPTATSTSNASPSRIAALSSADPIFPARPVDNPERHTTNAFEDAPGEAGARLRRMFATPDYVHANEPLEKVCRAAQRADHWVLVAIRDASFLSNCVARDVWNVAAMTHVAPSLECVEYDVASPVGLQCASSFQVPSTALPCLFLVDPFTYHQEMNLRLPTSRTGGIDGSAVVDELLIFIASKGSPRQLHAALEEDVDEPDGVATDAEAEGGAERAATAARSEPPPPPAPAPAVSIEEWEVPAGEQGGFKLRVRLPKTSLTLCLKPEMPVSFLFRYLASRVCADDPLTYPAPPAIEVRGGFPPKALAAPSDAEAPLSAWAAVRSGEALTVHLT